MDPKGKSRADWPELRDYRLKVRGKNCAAENAPPTFRRPKRATRKNIASIAATRVCTLTFHGIRLREKNRIAFGVNVPLET